MDNTKKLVAGLRYCSGHLQCQDCPMWGEGCTYSKITELAADLIEALLDHVPEEDAHGLS